MSPVSYSLPSLSRARPRSHKDSGWELHKNYKKAPGLRQKPVSCSLLCQDLLLHICSLTSWLSSFGSWEILVPAHFLYLLTTWFTPLFVLHCVLNFHSLLDLFWPSLLIHVMSSPFDLYPSLDLLSIRSFSSRNCLPDSKCSVQPWPSNTWLWPGTGTCLTSAFIFMKCSKYWRVVTIKNVDSVLRLSGLKLYFIQSRLYHPHKLWQITQSFCVLTSSIK